MRNNIVAKKFVKLKKNVDTHKIKKNINPDKIKKNVAPLLPGSHKKPSKKNIAKIFAAIAAAVAIFPVVALVFFFLLLFGISAIVDLEENFPRTED